MIIHIKNNYFGLIIIDIFSIFYLFKFIFIIIINIIIINIIVINIIVINNIIIILTVIIDFEKIMLLLLLFLN